VSGLHHVELCPRSLRYYTTKRPQGLCRKQTRRMSPFRGMGYPILGKLRRSRRVRFGHFQTFKCLWPMSAYPQKRTFRGTCAGVGPSSTSFGDGLKKPRIHGGHFPFCAGSFRAHSSSWRSSSASRVCAAFILWRLGIDGNDAFSAFASLSVLR
jgi:hypothetical protein